MIVEKRCAKAVSLGATIERQIQRHADRCRTIVKRKIERLVVRAACANRLRSVQIQNRFQIVGRILNQPPIVRQKAALIHQVKPLYQRGHHRVVHLNLNRNESSACPAKAIALTDQLTSELDRARFELSACLRWSPPDRLVEFSRKAFHVVLQIFRFFDELSFQGI